MDSPRFTQEEIYALAQAIAKAQQTEHICRLARVAEADLEDMVRIHHEVSPDDLKEAIKFYKNFNTMMSESSRTLRNLIVTLGFGTVVGLILVGVWAEIRNRIGL